MPVSRSPDGSQAIRIRRAAARAAALGLPGAIHFKLIHYCHLFRYLDEQAYRYNERHGRDPDRFRRAIRRIIGKRLTYDQLRGKSLRGKKSAGAATARGRAACR